MFYSEIEKFISDSYWPLTHDKRSQLDIVKVVQERLREEAKKDPEYFERKPGVVHASYLSQCLRGNAIGLLGGSPDDEPNIVTLGKFLAGHLFEDFIVNTLGDRVIERQREYALDYKGIKLVGRSDFKIQDGDVTRLGEAKSVHSDSFWYRKQEGTLIATHNQMQLQTYLWLERVLNKNEWDGIFFYVSKDDVTVDGAAIKFNPLIINNGVLPVLDLLAEVYEKKDVTLAPLPPAVIYNESKHQYQVNWLCKYCDFHSQCAGANWLKEAMDEVARKNKELKAGLGSMKHMEKKAKPTITATPV